MPRTMAPTGRTGQLPTTTTGRVKSGSSGKPKVAGRKVTTRDERIEKLEALDKRLSESLKALGLIFGEIHLISASKCMACHGSMEDRRAILKKEVEAKDGEDSVVSKVDDKGAAASSTGRTPEHRVLDKLAADVSSNLELIEMLPKLMDLIHQRLCTSCKDELDHRSDWARFSMYR